MVNMKSIALASMAAFGFVQGGYAETTEEDIAAKAEALEVTKTTFDQEVLEEDRPFLVEFGATWCGSCERLKPEMVRLSEAFSACLGVAIVDLNEGDNNDLIFRFEQETYIPRLFLFQEGEVVGKAFGAGHSAEQIGDWVREKVPEAGHPVPPCM